jgi:hypothetical protein
MFALDGIAVTAVTEFVQAAILRDARLRDASPASYATTAKPLRRMRSAQIEPIGFMESIY